MAWPGCAFWTVCVARSICAVGKVATGRVSGVFSPPSKSLMGTEVISAVLGDVVFVAPLPSVWLAGVDACRGV